jgi:hypothetical protein
MATSPRIVYLIALSLQQHRVALDAGLRRAVQPQQQMLAQGRGLELPLQPRQPGLQREDLVVHRHDVGVQLRDVQQRVHLRRQRLQRQVHLRHDDAALVVERALVQRRAEQRERVHRLAQVVAGRGQEARLGRHRRLRLRQRLAQLLVVLHLLQADQDGFGEHAVGVARQTGQDQAEEDDQRRQHPVQPAMLGPGLMEQAPGQRGGDRHRPQEHLQHDAVAGGRGDRAGAQAQQHDGLHHALEIAQEGRRGQRGAEDQPVDQTQPDRPAQALLERALMHLRQAAQHRPARGQHGIHDGEPAVGQPGRHHVGRHHRHRQRGDAHRIRDAPALLADQTEQFELDAGLLGAALTRHDRRHGRWRQRLAAAARGDA